METSPTYALKTDHAQRHADIAAAIEAQLPPAPRDAWKKSTDAQRNQIVEEISEELYSVSDLCLAFHIAEIASKKAANHYHAFIAAATIRGNR